MRTKLGLTAATTMVVSLLAFGGPIDASADESSTTTTTAAPETTVEEAPPPSTDPTTEPLVTTTLPGAISGGATVGVGAAPPALPTRSETQVTLYPPPPQTFGLPSNSGTGRRVVYSKSEQTLWVVDANGIVIKNHRVSGKLNWCDPKPGTYSVYSRSRYTSSLTMPAIRWGYMVRFAKGCNGGNIGFHEIPTDTRIGQKMQTVAQLGQPLSGGCVRQSIPDAIWMWNWAYIGTKVVVLP